MRRSQALDPYHYDGHCLFPPLAIGQIAAVAIELCFAFDLEVDVRFLGQKIIHLGVVCDILGELRREFQLFVRELLGGPSCTATVTTKAARWCFWLGFRSERSPLSFD